MTNEERMAYVITSQVDGDDPEIIGVAHSFSDAAARVILLTGRFDIRWAKRSPKRWETRYGTDETFAIEVHEIIERS